MEIIVKHMSRITSKTDAVTVKASTLPQTQPKELTRKEQDELKELEATITKSSEAKFDLASALGKICEDKLYLAQYETFEEYCKKRWKMSRSYGHRYLTLDEVMTDLKEVTEAAKVLPPNEAQARHYGNLETNERQELLKKVCSESNGKGSSSKLILKWKKELFPEKCAAKDKPVDATIKLKKPPTGKRLVHLYNSLVSIYDMTLECEGETDYSILTKEIIDQFKPRLDPDAVKAVAKEAEEKAAKEVA